MNGFTNSKQLIFVNLYKGTFRIATGENDDQGVHRTKKTGETVNELSYDSFTGQLVDIEARESDYGDQWNVTMTDGKDNYLIRFPISGRITNGFLFRLPNIDLTKKFTIRLFWFESEERGACGVYQGKKIEPAFTRDNPGGLPDLVPVRINGRDSWDAGDRIQFLKDMVDTDIRPQLKETKVLFEPHPEEAQDDNMPLDDDVLPF